MLIQILILLSLKAWIDIQYTFCLPIPIGKKL